MPDPVHVVICRYEEGLEWADSIKWPVTVYNKGGPLECKHKVVGLPNVGREAHAYLWHIAHNYPDGFADVTVFLQGSPGPHCTPGFIEKINAGFPELKKPVSLGDTLWRANADGHSGHIDVAQSYELWFGLHFPGFVWFPFGACMAVPRDAICYRPYRFYKKRLDELGGEPAVSAALASVLEALWFEIFRGAE